MPKTQGEGQGTATGLTEEDLNKGLGRLDDFIASHDDVSRKEQLLQKALGEDLDDDERTELFQIMGGGGGDADAGSRADEIVKSFSDNDQMQKALDVSEFLAEQHEALTKSLSTLAEYQERSETRQHDFNIVLARTVSDSGKLIKAMSERLGVIERQPARPPKSRIRKDQVLEKSFDDGGGEGGGDGGGKQLNRAKILTGLNDLMVKSMEGGVEPGLAACGEDLSVAVATFEQLSQISEPMLEEVRQHISQAR